MAASLVLPKKQWLWSAAQIKKLRGDRSLVEFAAALGVPKKIVSLWEANRGPTPDSAKLSALARKETFRSARKLKGSVAWISEDVGTGERLANTLIRASVDRTAREL